MAQASTEPTMRTRSTSRPAENDVAGAADDDAARMVKAADDGGKKMDVFVAADVFAEYRGVYPGVDGIEFLVQRLSPGTG